MIASFAIATYAFFEIAAGSAPVNFAIWFIAAIVVHDMIAFPLYSVLGVIAGAGLQRPDLTPGLFSINFVRIPALLSGFVFIVWFPVILGFSEPEVMESTGLGTDPFLGPLAPPDRSDVPDLGRALRGAAEMLRRARP